ncbi:MAG: diguanylate cyclase domain-containing protein [Coprobacillus cateniformis]
MNLWSSLNMGDVEKRVREIHDCVSCRYKEYPISLSMGIALYPENGDDYEDIYKHADQALYSAKKSGRKQYSFYQE